MSFPHRTENCKLWDKKGLVHNAQSIGEAGYKKKGCCGYCG